MEQIIKNGGFSKHNDLILYMIIIKSNKMHNLKKALKL